jgi:hypothetical protein
MTMPVQVLWYNGVPYLHTAQLLQLIQQSTTCDREALIRSLVSVLAAKEPG